MTTVQDFLATLTPSEGPSLSHTKSDDMTDFLAHFGVKNQEKVASLVLVALPRETDPVHGVGEEEKHATLLYFGDSVTPAEAELARASIQKFVQDQGMWSFAETVHDVSSLGDDSARVWLIDSDNGLRATRDRLLQRDSTLRALYDRVAQYPNFTPHVTVGYPTEGESSLDDQTEAMADRVKNINFDRLALWYGDNHDVTWRLPTPEQRSVELDHSEKTADFIAHVLADGGSGSAEAAIRKKMAVLVDKMNKLQSKLGERFKNDLVQAFGPKVLNYETKEDILDTIPQAERPASRAKLRAIVASYKTSLEKEIKPIVVELTRLEGKLQHSDDMSDFLAHHGVKGQKWGVRRSSSQLARGRGGVKMSESDADENGRRRFEPTGGRSKKIMDKLPVGSRGVFKDKNGNETPLIKNADGSWSQAHLSDHAINFIKASQKPHYELTDSEIRDAVTRAKLLKEYNDVFNTRPGLNTQTGKKPTADLQAKVDKLKLQREYAQLRRDMNPSRVAKAQKHLSAISTAYSTYNKLDKSTGNQLSAMLKSKFGIKLPTGSAVDAMNKAAEAAAKADKK